MLVDIPYRCGHTVSTSLLEIRSISVEDQVRNRRSDHCPNCRDEEQREESRKRWALIEERNRGLPPFDDDGDESERRRAMEVRAKARWSLDNTAGRLRLELEERGVMLRTRKEAEEGLRKIAALMACTSIREWLARSESPMTNGQIGEGCERLASNIRWRARRRR